MIILADWPSWLTHGWIWLLVGIAALMYVIAPLLIWQTMSLNARAPVHLLAPAYLSPEAWHYFQSTAPGLADCGFRVTLYGRITDQVPNVNAEVALWVNDQTGQLAMAARISNGAQYLEFSTIFADRSSVLTNNCTELGVFKQYKESDAITASWIQDPRELYRLHLYRETLATPGDPARYVPQDHDVPLSLQEGTELVMLRQVKAGYYHKANDAGLFRMTLPGAFIMTWKMLPPFKYIRKAAARRRAQAQMREAAARPIAQPTHARITHISPYRSAIELGTL